MAMIESIRLAPTLAGTGPVVNGCRPSAGPGFAELVAQGETPAGVETPPGVHAPPGGTAGRTEGANPDVQTAQANSPDSPPDSASDSKEPGDTPAVAACPPYVAVLELLAQISFGQPTETTQAMTAAPRTVVALLPAEAAPTEQLPNVGGRLEADAPKFHVGTSLLSSEQAEALNITRVETATMPGVAPSGDALASAVPPPSVPASAATEPAPSEPGPAPNRGAASTNGTVGQPVNSEGPPPLIADGTSAHEGVAAAEAAEPTAAALWHDRHSVVVDAAPSERTDVVATGADMQMDSIPGDSDGNREGGAETLSHTHTAASLRHIAHPLDSPLVVGPGNEQHDESGPTHVQIARQIIERLDDLAVRGAGRRVTLELEPHGLGRVSIRLLSFGNAMEAAVVASDRSVGAALESAAPQLAAALRHRGIELASISVQHDATLDLSNGHSSRGHMYASDSDRRSANNLSLAGQTFAGSAPVVLRPILGSITELDVLA